MKRKFLLYFCFFTSILCYAADYLVIKDRNLYDGNFNAVGAIKKGTVVKKNSTYTYSPKRASVQPDFKKGTDILYKGKEYVIDEEAIIPFETKELFDENVITSNKKLQGKYLTYIEDCDVLYSRERETYYKLHENAINYYENHIRGDYDGPWYENETINPSGISNIDLTLRTDSRVMLLIKKITKITDGYEVETEVFRNDYDELDYDYELFSEYFKPGSDATVIIICDGDYINFYTKEKRLLVTCAYVDEEFATQYERLIQEDLCDLTNIIWPRHADGSCDYEENKKSSLTNVTLRKIVTVSENLKLRAGEATSTQVLTVMSAGTKVKILELGNSETIDGIKSNWVKVEVISGRDRDGKDIKKKTTGWCYGGYLE